MPRAVRIEYAGAVYHVMCRGDRREAIFLDNRDREKFLGTLAEICGRTGALVHSYVLMGNHYHVLLETPEPNLVARMKWLQGTYTQRFNARHRQARPPFPRRYKPISAEAENRRNKAADESKTKLDGAGTGLGSQRCFSAGGVGGATGEVGEFAGRNYGKAGAGGGDGGVSF